MLKARAKPAFTSPPIPPTPKDLASVLKEMVDDRIAAAREMTFAQMSIACDGLPVFNTLDGSSQACAPNTSGPLVFINRSHGVPSLIGVAGGRPFSGAAAIGGLPLVIGTTKISPFGTACDKRAKHPESRRFVNLYNDSWDYLGNYLGPNSAGGVLAVKEGNEYFVDFIGGAYPIQQPVYICAAGVPATIGDGLGSPGNPGPDAIQIGYDSPNPALADGYGGVTQYQRPDSWPTVPAPSGKMLHYDDYAVGHGPLIGYTVGMERKLFSNPNFPAGSQFGWVGAFALSVRTGGTLVARDTRFVVTGNGAVDDSAGAINDTHSAPYFDCWSDDCGRFWVQVIRSGSRTSNPIWQGTFDVEGLTITWEPDVTLGTVDADGNTFVSHGDDIVRTVYVA